MTETKKTETEAQHRQRLVCEIMEARYLRAINVGTDAQVASAEMHLIKAHRKLQELHK